MRAQWILTGALVTLAAGCNGLDDNDWGSGSIDDFIDCPCTYTVTGDIESDERGISSLFETNARGDKAPYRGGPASLEIDCAVGPRESSNKGLVIVLDDFRGSGSYPLSASGVLDPSSMALFPANLSERAFVPVEGSNCFIDIYEYRGGDFVCEDLRLPSGEKIAVVGRFNCG